jgi:hypothetical protein
MKQFNTIRILLEFQAGKDQKKWDHKLESEPEKQMNIADGWLRSQMPGSAVIEQGFST